MKKILMVALLIAGSHAMADGLGGISSDAWVCQVSGSNDLSDGGDDQEQDFQTFTGGGIDRDSAMNDAMQSCEGEGFSNCIDAGCFQN